MPTTYIFICLHHNLLPVALPRFVGNHVTEGYSAHFAVVTKFVVVHDDHVKLDFLYVHGGDVNLTALVEDWVGDALLGARLPF